MDSTAVRFLEETPSYLDTETDAIIRVEAESELTPRVEDFLEDLTVTCAAYPSWFDPGGTIEATQSNIELELGTNGIRIRSSNGLPGDPVRYQDFSGGSEDQDRVSSLVDDFTDVVGSDESINIHCELAKQSLSRSVVDSHDIAASVHVWTAKDVLADWLEDTNPEHIEEQYVDPQQPLLLFIGSEDIEFEPDPSWIALAPLSAVDNVCDEYTQPTNPIVETVNYTNQWTDEKFEQSQHSLLFNSAQIRELFDTTFLHTAFRTLSDESPIQQNPHKWTYTISNQDPPLTSDIDYSEYALQSENLTEIYHIISGFHTVPTKNLQRYWLQAISRSCNSHEKIPYNRDQIEKYFKIFEDGVLQDTLAEATETADKLHELVSTLQKDLTDSTQSVTNQVKTIIYGLVAAVITNTFLVIRWGDISQTLPFSLFIISIGLLAYLPITAAQLRDTDKSISQSISNFRSTYMRIYNISQAGLNEYEFADGEQLLTHKKIRDSLQGGFCGSQSLLKELKWVCSSTDTDRVSLLTDADHIGQKNAAVTNTQNRITWSIKYLHRLYVILALSWIVIAGFSLTVYTPSTAPYIGTTLSTIPALVLLIRDSRLNSSTVPFARNIITILFTILLSIVIFNIVIDYGLMMRIL